MKELIEKAKKIVILTHMAPDGDAMGSALAIWHWVKGLQVTGYGLQVTGDGLQATVIVPNAFAAFFNWMPGAEAIKVYEKEPEVCNTLIAEADLFICTDFNDPKRINPAGDKMLANPAPKILIDHHIMDERIRGLVDEGLWGEVHSDPAASSSCEIVYRLITGYGLQVTGYGLQDTGYGLQDTGYGLQVTGYGLTKDIATCLYTGLMTDTGNFAYSSSRPEVFEMAAALLRAGIDKEAIFHAVFDQFSIDRMRLTGYALYRKMRIYPEYHLALITLSADELDQYHYQPGDTEGLVNMPLQIGDVFYSVFMREERAKPGTPKSRIRISFRSQGDRPVNIWANEVFHGGGHMNASGGELFGSLNQAVRLFEGTFRKYLKV